MEDKKKNAPEPFYLYRSEARCLSVGISFLTDHFLRLLRLSLPVSLPVSLCAAGLLFLCSDGAVLAARLPVALVLAAVLVLLHSFSLGYVFQLVRLRIDGADAEGVGWRSVYAPRYSSLSVRMLALNALQAALSAAFAYAMLLVWRIPTEGQLEELLKIGGMALAVLAFWLVTVPLAQCYPSACLGEGVLWRSVWSGYVGGWRKYGKVFTLSLMLYFLVGIAAALVSLPAAVMWLARRAAMFSMAEGDAVYLPAGFGAWMLAVLAVTAFLGVLATWLWTLPHAYLYAAIEVNRREGEQNKIPLI